MTINYNKQHEFKNLECSALQYKMLFMFGFELEFGNFK